MSYRLKDSVKIFLALIIFSFLISCNKSSDSSSNTGSTITFAIAYPSDLVVSSPTAQKSAAGVLSISSNNYHSLSVDADSNNVEKSAALDAVISGKSASDCAINVQLANAGRANCYGPTISLTNHPGGPTPTFLPGGDLGIWSESETGSGEGCAAAELNQQMRGVASQVDAGLFAMAGLVCMAGVSGNTLPAIGSSIDLASSMNGKVTINGTVLNLTVATLAREVDTSEGHPVYISTIQGDNYFFRLKHIATATDNTTFKGKLSLATPNNDKTSISYSKTSNTSLVYELKSVNGASSAWVSSTDYTAKVSTGWQNNANYLLTNYDPSSGAGNYLYAWQAGSGDSHARVFNAAISGAGTSQTGIAYFGFGPNMAATSGLGSISGMICNWAGPSNSHTPINYVQKQTLTVTNSKFVAGSSNITYDPVSSCESSDASFSYTGPAGTAITSDSTTLNLVGIAEVSTNITTPTAPLNVDL